MTLLLPLVRRNREPTRVCVVAPSLDILGGQAVQAARLLEHLRTLPGLHVDLLPVNPRLPGPLRRLQAIKYLRTIVTSIRYFASLFRNVRRYDVLHVFSASYVSFLLAPLPAMIVGRLFGKRVVLNYHSGEAEDHLTRWRRTAVPAMRLAHDIIVPSDYLVAVFARFGLRARAIPNFVDVGTLPYRERESLRPQFMANRNLEPLYNVGCAIRAFALVQAELRDASLTVAGFGRERRKLESLVRELGLRNVSFVGRVPPERMGALYDAADIYINSSNIDNMPLSILDAFATGVPVVTTDPGGIPYVVRDGENGMLVRCGDHEALAAAALRLLRQPAFARRIAAQARLDCLQHYVWPAVAAQWMELYAGSVIRAVVISDRPQVVEVGQV